MSILKKYYGDVYFVSDYYAREGDKESKTLIWNSNDTIITLRYNTIHYYEETYFWDEIAENITDEEELKRLQEFFDWEG